MAAVRTRGCFVYLVAVLSLCAVLLNDVQVCESATAPSVDPNNSSVIIWGDLPPIQPASNLTNDASRPGTLAQMAEGFVNLIQPQGLPFDYIAFALEVTVYNETSYYEDNWSTEMWKIMGLMVGIVVCILFGAFYFVIVPFIGLFFSYCRCCNNCGGKRVQREKKNMGCKRVTLSLFFFSLTGIICAGMAFTNVSNEFISDSVDEFKSTADFVFINGELYITGVDTQIDYMLNTEYDFYDELMVNNVENIGSEIGDPVIEYVLSEAGLQAVIDSANNMSSTFSMMGTKLTEIETLTAYLVANSSTLEDELSAVRVALTDINADPDCNNCVTDIDQLTVKANFSLLPSLSMQIQGVNNASQITDDILSQVDAVLADIPEQITNMSADAVQDALTQLETFRVEIKDLFDQVNATLATLMNNLERYQTTLDGAWEDEVQVYAQYVYYALIGLTCTVLLIVMFNLIGLTMGTFSYKNVSPTDRSRMSNAGGNVLMAGVFFSFFFAPILMLLCLVSFSALSAITLTCDPLLTYQAFNETIDQPNVITEGYAFGKWVYDNGSIPLTASGILEACEKDEPAYQAFLLDSQIDLEAVREKLDELSAEVDKLIDGINPDDLKIDFPFSDFIDDLNKLAGMTGLEQLNYTAYEEVLNTEITETDLTEYAAGLRITAGTNPDVSDELNEQADALDLIQANIVDQMFDYVVQIQIDLDMLQELEMNLGQQINETIEAIVVAETAIESNATSQAVIDISEAYADRLVDYTYQFYYKLESQVTQDFAKCGPVSTIYLSSINSMCDYPVAAGNTFWFTVGWCVFFYMPSVIFAVKLAKYYRIMDEEAPYRPPKKSKKKRKAERRRSDEEMAMGDMDGNTGAGADNIHLVESNGRPPSMMAQQNPNYMQDEPIMAYNDLGRPMAPPPAYNAGEPFNIPPHDYYF